MDKRYKSLASNTMIFGIGNILVKLISFFLMPLYTSVLSAKQYGISELLNNSVEIALPLFTLCIIEALYRFSIDDNSNYKVLFANSLIIIIIGDLVMMLICAISYFIFDYQYSFYFLLLYITTANYKLTTQFSRGLGHVKRYTFYGVLNSIILVISNIILLIFLEGGISAYLLSFSISYGISGTIAFILSKEYVFFNIKNFDIENLKEMLRYSLPNIPNMISWWINSLSDRYIILYFFGAGLTGLYTAASKLPAIINLVTSIFQQSWQYSTAREIKNDDNTEFFSNVFSVYAFLSIVSCSLLIILNKFICKFLLHYSFYESWKYVPLLLLAATFGSIATYFGTFYNAMKKNKNLMFSTFIGATINIVTNFIFIPKLGGMGAAIATAISYFIIMLIRMLDISRVIELEINYYKFTYKLIVIIIAAIFGCLKSIVSIIVPIIALMIIIIIDFDLLKNLKNIISSYFSGYLESIRSKI